MKDIVLFGHGGSYNHGCEAIVRSTLLILKDTGAKVRLYSNSTASDREFGLDKLVELRESRRPFHIKNPVDCFAMAARKFFKWDSLYLKRFFVGFMDDVKDSVCISIGGDMYCYGRLPWLYYTHRLLQKNRNKTVLWGCSVDKDSFFPEAKEDLLRYDLILTRESISYELFRKNGIPNVELFPDPAFLLEPEETAAPFPFNGKNTVAVNISPLITQYKGTSPLDENIDGLFRHLLKDTAYDILLVPHVNGNTLAEDDYTFLKERMEGYHSKRIQILPPSYNCRQLKYFISQCRFLVTARTHASIAAYSTGVPTLVLGYSTKSRGIARDLFGTEEHYVLPVKELTRPEEMADAFDWIAGHEEEIRRRLNEVIPGVRQRAAAASGKIEELLRKD